MRGTGAALVAAGCMAALAARAQPGGFPFCQIADRLVEPAGALEFGYVDRSDVEDAGSFGFVEERAHANVVYAEFEAGKLDLTAFLNLWVTTGGEIAGLPDRLGQFYLRALYDWRTPIGLTARAEVAPGLYSDFADLQSGAFGFPVALSGILAVNEVLSAQVGISAWPGFQEPWQPLLLLRWEPAEGALLDVGYPESRLSWQVAPLWTAVAGLSVHRTWDFGLEEDDARDRIAVRDARVYAGADRLVGETLLLSLRAGAAWAREIEFEDGTDGAQDVDGAFYFSIGIGSAF